MKKPAKTHTFYMRAALAQARLAARRGEVPVGAVIVHDGRVLAKAHNAIIARRDPSAHAELLALRAAAARLRNERLTGCTLYATLEPCPMCAGAMVLARIDALVFGARRQAGVNHRFPATGGLLAPASSRLLKEFFAKRR